MTRRRIIVLWDAAAAAVMLVGTGLVAWWAAVEVASPPRRPLQEYHREFLAHPDVHGVSLQSFTLEDGTPCLMTTPLVAGATTRTAACGGQWRAYDLTSHESFQSSR